MPNSSSIEIPLAASMTLAEHCTLPLGPRGCGPTSVASEISWQRPPLLSDVQPEPTEFEAYVYAYNTDTAPYIEFWICIEICNEI